MKFACGPAIPGIVPACGKPIGAPKAIGAGADGHGKARFRLDVGMLDERRFERAFGGMRGNARYLLRTAALDDATRQNVVGLTGMQRGCSRRECRSDAVQHRQRLPRDREVASLDRLHRLARSDQGQHRLAAVTHQPIRKHRLVLEVGIDAERVLAGHVTGRENADDTGVASEKRREVADREGAV